MFGRIYHYTLENGMHVVVNPDETVPKVSVQLWYAVGSKDEQSSQKGLAHLLEHMIFKGTKRLSESDINVITSKCSGYTNAFTSYDYTGYLFDFPKEYWTVALDLMADCMTNCTFDENMLQSELKAVIQELKLYKDDYQSSLVEEMFSNIFPDHPYHHPIIGYKQDLWNINHDGLMRFYKQYYAPNNATLVVVGDVDPQEVLEKSKAYFGAVQSSENPKKVHSITRDIQQTSLTLYRDIQNPLIVYAWRVPGMSRNKELIMRVASYVLGESKSSLLYQLLVDELHLAADVHMSLDDTFDAGVLLLQIDPVDQDYIQEIEKEVCSVLATIYQHGINDDQLLRAFNQAYTEYAVQLEEFQERAYMIGKAFLATGDPNYINTYMQHDQATLKQHVIDFIKTYIRPTIMHKGYVLPLPEEEKKYWLDLQQKSDEEDAVILSRKVRESVVEPGRYVHAIDTQEPVPYAFPAYQEFVLNNGLSVLFYEGVRSDKVEIVIDFDAQFYYDPYDLQGLGNFVFAVMQEGTKHYTKTALMQAFADKGMHLQVYAGSISLTLLKNDLAYGLGLLYELLAHATFDNEAIEKVRKYILSDIDDFWDEPNQFVQQFAREHIYKGHPYSKRYLGTHESIGNITREDLIAYYKNFITPARARMAIIGNCGDTVERVCQDQLGGWRNNGSFSLEYPRIMVPDAKEIIYPIARDQVVLAFAGLSVDRQNSAYDALVLFDHIFTGGTQHAMSSHLFQLREQTGLFYTIGGSLVLGADEQPGMFYIKTMVSRDRLDEAEKSIKQAITSASEKVTEDDINIAKNALIHQFVDHYATQKSIAHSFLFIKRMQLPRDYFNKRIGDIKHIGRSQLVDIANNIMQLDKISTLKIGRLAQ